VRDVTSWNISCKGFVLVKRTSYILIGFGITCGVDKPQAMPAAGVREAISD
jgi:hypothetical protein